MISYTVFKSQFDNSTDRQTTLRSWKSFVKMLYKLSDYQYESKRQAFLISPATYPATTDPDDPVTRRNKNVVGWGGWAAVDVDDADISGDQLDSFISKWNRWHYVCYNTASSRFDKPKFRMIFPLSRFLKAEEIKHFWFNLQTDMGDVGDKQCKDLSRMYYVPGTYANAFKFFKINVEGSQVDVDALLAKYPFQPQSHSKDFIDRLPEHIQKQIIDYRRGQSTNTGYSWTSYHDCPFINKKQISEYKSIAHTDGTGRYRMIYSIMCVTALNAVNKHYPITTNELVTLIKQLDAETTNRYQERPLIIEANNALEFAYRKGAI